MINRRNKITLLPTTELPTIHINYCWINDQLCTEYYGFKKNKEPI